MSELKSILDVKLKCPACKFKCSTGEAFPDVDKDGSLGCPICFTVMTEENNGRLEPVFKV